jgi:predicted metalloprotease with PDZ domain
VIQLTKQRNSNKVPTLPFYSVMKLKNLLPLLFGAISLVPLTAQAQKGNNYQYTVDLATVKDDRVRVELIPPRITSDEITFYLPKIIPGTYAIADYGRYVSDFSVVDKKGRPLSFERLNDNAWKIKTASKIHKITYWVNDSYDTEITGPKIFEPAGTNIEENKNFLINSAGYFGYLENLKEIPVTLNVIRPEAFYGSTGLIPQKSGEPLTKIKLEKGTDTKGKKVDTYLTDDYDQLIDSPLMYSLPDTAIIKVGNTEVLIGAYSAGKKVNAKEIAASVREVLMAQKEYLGGELPVNKYAFIFYFTDQPIYSYGALEHSSSSFYYMPDATIDQMNQQLRDFAAHEFFHIVTPLTIHSEEIDNFDYNDPKMSAHLWLYEGVTEYFAGNVQVKHELISTDEYLDVLRQKILTAETFKDTVPFTDISKFTLTEYKDQYYNVYQKGALIGMCLDIKLRHLSKGEYGLQNLVKDLSKKYGKSKPFEDSKLFDEITALTYPEIGEFLKRHVGGPDKLPLKEMFDLVGVNYIESFMSPELTLGLESNAVTVADVQGGPKLSIADAQLLNAQGKALGFQNEDVLLKINGESIPYNSEFKNFFQRQQQGLQAGKEISYSVLRKDSTGSLQEVELAAEAIVVEREVKHLLGLNQQATPDQVSLRKSWISE